MKYEEKLFLRLKKNLNRYFPGEKLRIIKIKMISELYKDVLETRTYKCVLNGSRPRTRPKVLYVKYFTDYKIKKLKGIKRLKKFNKYINELKIPRVYDFYKDLNSIVVEGVSGTKSSKLFPIYLLPVLKTFYFTKIKNILEEVAEAVANLHKITQKKGKPKVALNFSDLKLGNVLFDGREIKIIDFEMVETHYMEDLVCFMASLEMLQKFPHISQEDVELMKNIFYKKYSSSVNWKINHKLLRKAMKDKRYEILQTLRNEKARRGVGIFGKIIIKWNIIYLKNKLKN